MSRPNAQRQLARQWRMLLALTERPRCVANLARTHGVSKATAQRDVDTLAEVFDVRTAGVIGHKQRLVYVATLEAKP